MAIINKSILYKYFITPSHIPIPETSSFLSAVVSNGIMHGGRYLASLPPGETGKGVELKLKVLNFTNYSRPPVHIKNLLPK